MAFMGNDGCAMLPAVAEATPWPSYNGGPETDGLDEETLLSDADIDQPLTEEDERRLWRLLSN